MTQLEVLQNKNRGIGTGPYTGPGTAPGTGPGTAPWLEDEYMYLYSEPLHTEKNQLNRMVVTKPKKELVRIEEFRDDKSVKQLNHELNLLNKVLIESHAKKGS